MSQRDVLLRLLKERGAKGVSAHELVFERGITRGAAVVFDLRAEGYDIETIDEGTLPDGRKKLARYVLKPSNATTGPRTEYSPAQGAYPGEPSGDPLIAALRAELRPLPLPCGCVRTADGRGWEGRCASHGGAKAEAEVAW